MTTRWSRTALAHTPGSGAVVPAPIHTRDTEYSRESLDPDPFQSEFEKWQLKSCPCGADIQPGLKTILRAAFPKLHLIVLKATESNTTEQLS